MLAASVGLAGCDRDASDITGPAGSGLDDPPSSLLLDSARGVVMQGVADRFLFVRADHGDVDRFAALDVESETWRDVEPPPDLDHVTLGALDTAVVVIGLDCDGKCADGEKARYGAASLDLADTSAHWRSRPLALEPIQVGDSGGAAVLGELAGSVLVDVGGEVLALTGDLESTRVPVPPPKSSPVCVGGDRLQALVLTPEAAARPAHEPGETLGMHVLAEASLDPSGIAELRWRRVPGTETDGLSSQLAGGFVGFCGPRGVLLFTGAETYEWDGARWVGRSFPRTRFLNDVVVTSRGTLVGRSGDVVLVASVDRWNVVDGPQEQTVPIPPHSPVDVIEAVDDRVMTYRFPSADEPTGAFGELAI